MPIRTKHLAWDTPGIKGHQITSIGDITADGTEKAVFVAPYACVLETIDVYTGQGVGGVTSQALSNSVTIMTIRAQLSDISGSGLATARGNSANGVSNTDAINANTRYRLICTANNSLSTGRVVELNFSQQGSGVLSAVIVDCTYRTLIHRETR